MARETVKVLFVNNDGGGFSETVEVPLGKTAGEFFTDKMGGDANPADYKIRVNRLEAQAGQMLQNDDRVTITPKNVKGA